MSSKKTRRDTETAEYMISLLLRGRSVTVSHDDGPAMKLLAKPSPSQPHPVFRDYADFLRQVLSKKDRAISIDASPQLTRFSSNAQLRELEAMWDYNPGDDITAQPRKRKVPAGSEAGDLQPPQQKSRPVQSFSGAKLVRSPELEFHLRPSPPELVLDHPATLNAMG